MSEPPLTEDLSVLARRGLATPSEERRLDMLLGASAVEHFLDELGRDCDREPLGEPGDSGLVARAVRRAQAPVARHLGRRPLAAALTLAALLGTGVAAALTVPRWLERNAADGAAVCVQCPAEGPTAEVAPPPRQAPAVSALSPSPPPSSSPLASAATARAGSPPRDGATPATAAEQFAKANALRRSGQRSAAVAAYWQLQKAHPSSPEAHLSHVVLGQLLLQQGSAAAAQEQFVRYLRAAPGGSLAEEAMFGRATALRVNGRTAEERQVLTELVARFPRSIIAPAARTRLDALE